VVLKELLARWRGDPAMVQRFLQEARIAGQLNHPRIVAVYEVERHGEDHYVVMEHLPGGSLHDRLGAPLPPAEALRIGRDVLDALAAAHARGVVHRDVKPANILFGPAGEAKLADFGIAQFADADPERTIGGLPAPTTSGEGTLAYMSPEQARGGPVDARSDVYAAGAVLFRMLTGKRHVELRGLDELAARAAIAEAQPRDLPKAPPGIEGVLRRALANRPEERYPSARAFADALDAVTSARARGRAG
jgi:serine/threonine protein kinase